MHRAIPKGNKIIAARNEQRRHELHRDRLSRMRSAVDTTEPSVRNFDHLRNNLKREQMLEERYYEIDRENRILLQKMSDIMRTSSQGGRARSGPPSLNRDFRKGELVRITQENQAILGRIQRAQPVYNHISWEDSHKKNLGYMKNACEYPMCLKKSLRSSSRGPGADTASQDGRGSRGDLTADDLSKADSRGGEGSRKYVLKEGKKIDDSYYLVEMATDGRTLTVTAYDGDTQRTLELLVSEKNHRKLYRECGCDYSALAGWLRVEGDQLVLDPATSGPYAAEAEPSSHGASEQII